MTGLQRLQLVCLLAAAALLVALLTAKAAPSRAPSEASLATSAVAVVPVNGSDSLGLPRRCIRRVEDLGRGLSEADVTVRIVQQCFRTRPVAATTKPSQAVLGCVTAVGLPTPGQQARVTGCLLD